MRDIRITRQADGSYDAIMENGRLVWAEDGTEAAQHALIRLLIFNNEWLLKTDNTFGTKWYEIVFNMASSEAEKELELKKRILQTPGIDEIIEWSWTQDDHSVTIEGAAKTQWGEVDISQTIEPL